MLFVLLTQHIISAFLGIQVELGTGFRFSAADDPWNPNAYAACLHREMNDSKDVIVAHRTLPCGTKVRIVNLTNGKTTTAVVGDRGPYGKSKDGSYRGIVDMSPKVDRALKGKGKAWVAIMPITKESSVSATSFSSRTRMRRSKWASLLP